MDALDPARAQCCEICSANQCTRHRANPTTLSERDVTARANLRTVTGVYIRYGCIIRG